MQKSKGFTLIELLIVVAIIAILAAIAVPNFLEAQVRAKVARVKADQRSLATAIESYYVDHGDYPPNSNGPSGGAFGQANNYRMLTVLSTPIAYISNALLPDPFPSQYKVAGSGGDVYGYVTAADDLANDVIQDVLVDGDVSQNAAAAIHLALSAAGLTAYESGLNQAQGDQLKSLQWSLSSQGPDRISRNDEVIIAAGGDPKDPGAVYGAVGFVGLLYEWGTTCPAIYDPTNGTVSRGDIIRTGKGIFEPRSVGL